MDDVLSLADEAEDLERVIEGYQDEGATEEGVENEGEAQDGENEGGDEESKKPVKAKRIVRNPQPKLNEETLRGKKGLPCLEKLFDKTKFKGRGYEDQDLNVLMKTYEYWCHRMFPKLPFDDVIARLEKLGTKRAVQTYMTKLRLGMLEDDELIPAKFLEEEERELNDGPIESNGFAEDDHFDLLLSQVQPEFRQAEPEPTINELSEEQLLRIEENKKRAEEIRAKRLQKLKEKASNIRQNSLLLPDSQSAPLSPRIVSQDNETDYQDNNGVVDNSVSVSQSTLAVDSHDSFSQKSITDAEMELFRPENANAVTGTCTPLTRTGQNVGTASEETEVLRHDTEANVELIEDAMIKKGNGTMPQHLSQSEAVIPVTKMQENHSEVLAMDTDQAKANSPPSSHETAGSSNSAPRDATEVNEMEDGDDEVDMEAFLDEINKADN